MMKNKESEVGRVTIRGSSLQENMVKKKKSPPCTQKCVFLLVPTDEYWSVTVLNDTRAEFDTGRLFFHINC